MNIFEGLKDKLPSEEERMKILADIKVKKEKKAFKKQEKQNQNIKQEEITKPKSQIIKTNSIHIITFLGMIDTKDDDKMAEYYADDFYLLDVKSGKYFNTTHIILEQLRQNDNFNTSFYTTKDALNKQESFINSYKVNEKIKFINYEKTDYNALYESLLEDISKITSGLIIIDITHGFRDNVFLSILASLIQINIKPKTKIKFMVAKELEPREKYQLISLDEYIENMIMSSVLSVFKQNLKVANYPIENSLYDSLCAFSDSLFTNFFMDIKECYIDFRKECEKLKNSNNFNLRPLLNEILKDFNFIDNWEMNIDYKQFYDLACLYAKHYYPSNAAQFLVEGVFLYMSEKLKSTFDIITNEKDINQIASDILSKVQDSKKSPLDIVDKKQKETKIKQVFERCVKELEKIKITLNINEKQFIGLLRLRKLWERIRYIRNPMSHCTTENSEFDINKELKSCLNMFYSHIIENDVLAK